MRPMIQPAQNSQRQVYRASITESLRWLGPLGTNFAQRMRPMVQLERLAFNMDLQASGFARLLARIPDSLNTQGAPAQNSQRQVHRAAITESLRWLGPIGTVARKESGQNTYLSGER